MMHARQDRARTLFGTLAYAPEEGLFLLDDPALAFGFLCRPLAGADQGVADRLNVFLNQDFPSQALVQVILWTSPDLEARLARMLAARAFQSHGLLRRTVHERAAFLRQGTRTPLEAGSGLLVRDAVVIVTVKVPIAHARPVATELARTAELRLMCEQSLATVGLAPRRLDADGYVRLLQTLLNWSPQAAWRDLVVPECDPTKVIRDQLLDFDTALRVDAHGIALGDTRVRLLSVKRYPEAVVFGNAMRYLGDVLSGSRGVRVPCVVAATLHYPEPEALRSNLQTHRQWTAHQAAGPIVRFVPQLHQRRQGFDALFEALDDGDRPVRMTLSLALFCPSDADAQAAVAGARTYFREVGLQLLEDRYFCLPLFLHCLPFGADRHAIRDLARYRTLGTRHAAALLPVLGDWQGTGTPMLNFLSRNGQLMDVSLFDSGSNYNGCIAAQSGSGKSFLTNEILVSYLSAGARCWVIDVGRSYQNLCALLGGDFVEFRRDSTLSLNPFELVRSWEEEADVLAGLVTAMAAPTEKLSDFQTAGVKRVLKAIWDAHGHATRIDDLAAALLAEPDGRLRDVGAQLHPFTSAGEYGRYFNGANTVSFRGDFTVLELEELKGRRHLQQVVLLQLIYQIQQDMYLGDRDRPKIVIIDEAWDLLTQGDVARFIETGYRRFRKYGGAAITVTQSVNDLYATPGGTAIAENSANMYLLGQKAETVEQLRRDRRLPLADGGYDLLKTVHTVPGAYSEVFFITGAGVGIGRLVVEPFKRLLYSTRAEDVHALRRLIESGMSVEQAVAHRLAEAGTRGR
ncbi:MAG: type IV secretion system protein TraC [Gammaproteobacteria bacterium]